MTLDPRKQKLIDEQKAKEAAERAGVKPIKFLPFKVFCNLCNSNPRAHWVATSLT